MTDIDLQRQALNLERLLTTFAKEFPKAVQEGRQRVWADAVIGVINMYATFSECDAAREQPTEGK